MVQFNLLPDIKKEYIKAKRTKRLIISVASLVTVASLVVTGLLFSFVQFGQKSNISDLTDDINAERAAIESIENLDEILTIQNQLRTLPELHQQKPETSRIFEYLVRVTPEQVKIQEVTLDFASSTLEIAGAADTIADINQYVDTLKFATYKTEDIDDGKPFTDVVSDLSRSNDTASYNITMVFDPILFDNTVDVTIVVPEQVTTRSVVGKPSLDDSELFESGNGGEQ